MKKIRENFAHSWHKFYFVISPDEFSEIFSGDDFEFIGQKHSNQPFFPTEKEKVKQEYRQFFENVLHSKVKKGFIDGWFQYNLIDDVAKIIWQDNSKGGTQKSVYDSAYPTEPFVGLQPLDLIFLKEKGQFSVAYHNPEGVIGMRLTYPKAIVWENTGKLTPTDDYAGKKLYESKVKAIKKLSKKAKISHQNQEHKPNFWISENAKKVINSNAYLRKIGVEMVWFFYFYF